MKLFSAGRTVFLLASAALLCAGPTACKSDPESDPAADGGKLHYIDDSKESYSYLLRENGNEILQGPRIVRNNQDNPFAHIRSVENYVKGTPEGVWAFHSVISSQELFFENGKPVRLVSYDVFGQKVADCFLRSRKPYSGTYWMIVLDHSTGKLKSSVLQTYQDGKVVSEAPCREQQISQLLETMKKIRQIPVESTENKEKK